MRHYASLRSAVQQSDLTVLPQYLLPLMMRNLATDGFRFTDPSDPGQFSAAGCIVASPSYSRSQNDVTQDYVFNWTRDAAVAAMELAFAHEPVGDAAGSGPLGDYVRFAATCQQTANTLAQACFTIEGRPRVPWVDQNDGPALQTLAVLQCLSQLDSATQQVARSVIAANVTFILDYYRNANYNLWEEVFGQSFFTRSVQLRCLLEVQANSSGIPVPVGIADVISWLRDALSSHWNDAGGYYTSVLDATNLLPGYDPNIDIVMACVYGALAPADARLLATAGLLRQQWTDPASSPVAYPINQTDAALPLGPLLGRYPGDVYDGDTNSSGRDHPWALCTANFAEFYYLLAAAVRQSGAVGYTPQTALFFGQVGVDTTNTPAEAAELLQAAGDRMLQAVIYHSDHLELSEQFDAETGFEKSVRNLTWSYAAFLSAMRARANAT